MPGKILCVAEKNSISKAVAGHLSGGQLQAVSGSDICCIIRLKLNFIQAQSRAQYVMNYTFTFDFGPPWGNCNVVMTAVSGHLTEAKFPNEFEQDWNYPPPDSLFAAPVNVKVAEVCDLPSVLTALADSSV